MNREQYARRAAEKYLEAWHRQGGECRTVSCGITYAANMLGKAINASDGALTLPGTAGTWWGHRYLHLAATIVAPATKP